MQNHLRNKLLSMRTFLAEHVGCKNPCKIDQEPHRLIYKREGKD